MLELESDEQCSGNKWKRGGRLLQGDLLQLSPRRDVTR